MPKKKQAESKLVNCEICHKQMHARGLNGHMRIKHKLVLRTITRVRPVVVEAAIYSTAIDDGYSTRIIEDDLPGDSSQSSSDSSKPDSNIDLSRLTRVIEQTVTYEKVNVMPGRLSRVIPTKDCHRCGKPVELKMVNPGDYVLSNDVKHRIVCEPCIKAYYEENSERAHYVKDAFGKNVFFRK